jgi:enamine deaminase RidA (YjgF/YER057c/UK114 family)
MSITRIAGKYDGRSRAVGYNGLVWAVATDQSEADGVAEQTKRTLAALEDALQAAGSDRTRILQATVYLTDLDHKTEMDRVWCDWIGDRANWPQRACVGAALAGATLVEIAVTAAAL